MSTVDYVPFATGGGALVTPQVTYLTEAPTGVVPGLADPALANKSWRQSSMLAAALANYISTALGIDVLDDGNLTTLITNLTSAIQLAGTAGISLGMGVPQNLRLAASVGSNNLTITVQGTNGANPSATNPVTVPFRDPTIASGEIVPRTIAAALSFTINSGSTMGVPANNQPFRLWVVAFDNAGTVALGAINCSIPGRVFPLNEDANQTSQAGTNGGSTAGLFYANVSAVTAKSIRILGYLEWNAGLAAAGVWNAIPTTIQLFGPGQRKPGEVVQTVQCVTSTSVPGNGATKADFTTFTPAVSITPTSKVNQIWVEMHGNGKAPTGANMAYSLFRGTDATPIGPQVPIGSGTAATTIVGVVAARVLDNPYTNTAQVYGGYVLGSASGNWLDSSIGPGGNGYIAMTEIMC